MVCHPYHYDLEKAKAYRKRKRIEQDTVAKRAPYNEAWYAANRERVLAERRKRKRARFEKGVAVWLMWAGHWCQGVIYKREGHRCYVRLVGGTRVTAIGRYLRTECPVQFMEVAGRVVKQGVLESGATAQ